MTGLRVYFDRHAFGSTTLADLLAALEPASGRDLGSWSSEWLETAGVNTLRSRVDYRRDIYRSVSVVQTATADHPTLRSHRIAIGLYDTSGDRLVRRDRIEVDVVGPRTDVPALSGVRVPDLLLLNDDDLTWAIPAAIRALPRHGARRLAAPAGGRPARRVRSSGASAVGDMTRDAELPVGGLRPDRAGRAAIRARDHDGGGLCSVAP